jgi:hypothetical protein
MWPWEHLAFGYLAYSAYTRLRHGRPPGHAAAMAVAFGTQFPDLVDKPLAWSLDVVSSATSVAHSAVVAAGAIALVGVVARRRGHPAIAAAFAVGYVSHLVGDVVYWVFRGGTLAVGVVLWPFRRPPESESVGLLAETSRLFVTLLDFLGTPAGVGYLVLEAALILGVLGLWLADGRPGFPLPRQK